MGVQQKGFHSAEPAFHAVNRKCGIWSCRTHVVGSASTKNSLAICKVVPTGNPLGLAFKQSEGQGGSVHGLWPLLIPAQAFCPLEKAHRK